MKSLLDRRNQFFNRPNNRNNNRNSSNPYPQNYQRQNYDNHNDPFSLMNETLQNMREFQYNTFQQIPTTVFTVTCGEVRPKDEGTRVKIAGKVVKRPRTGRFLEIKDLHGCTQLVATDDKPDILAKFQSIPSDAYICVVGKVQLRPNNFVNNVRPFQFLIYRYNLLM